VSALTALIFTPSRRWRPKSPLTGGGHNRANRGAGIVKEAAQQREAEARMRREHQQWSKELPKLQQRLESVEQSLLAQTAENKTLRVRLERTQRAYELLLMLASEAGVSPRELEALQEKR